MAIRLYVCGTRGSFPTFGKTYEGYGQATTCYVIREDDYAILLDCGTGLVNAVPVLAGCKRVDVILSHVHYDHIMGLFIIPDPCPGAEISFYGNFDAWTAVSNKGKGGSHTFWPDTIKKNRQIPVRPGSSYELGNNFVADFIPSTHGDGAYMTRLKRDGKTFIFTGDYEAFPESHIEDWVQDCDWLIYDGSYAPEEYPGHEGWGHSTWKNACELALKCNVGQLLITHYANTHDDESLRHEESRAKEMMKNVLFAREGMCYPLKGDPGEGISTFLYIENEQDRLEKPEPEPVKVSAKVREEELKKIAYTGWVRSRSYIAAAVNWLIFALSGTAAFTITGSGVSGIGISIPHIYLCLIMAISLLLSVFDLNSVDTREGSFRPRPHWANVAILTEVTAAMSLLLSFLIFWLPAEGLAALGEGGSWPGSAWTAFVIPLLVLGNCCFLEPKSKVSTGDLTVVIAFLLLIHGITIGFTEDAGSSLLTVFCRLPEAIIFAAIYIGSALITYFSNRLLLKAGPGYTILRPETGKQEKKKKGGLFDSERNRQVFHFVVHLLIALLSARHVAIALSTETTWFSNPALISAVLVIVDLAYAGLNIKAFKNNSVGVYPVWYKFLAYSMLAGTLINFFTANAVIVIRGESFLTLFTGTLWAGDVTVYVLCPILAGISFFVDSHEYDLNSVIYTGIVYAGILVGSRLGVATGKFEAQLPFEMLSFYEGNRFITTVFAEILVVFAVYLADRIYNDNARFKAGEVHVERDPEGKVELLVAGARGGVAPTKTEYYGFGQAANCYCIRDGSYGMILDCGSGLIYAPAFLKGCTHVDVFLSDTRFSTVMGLLAAPNPCPGARIRFYGPFGRGSNFENMNGFAMPPLWPVCVIVGECISATPDKDIRLNDRYSVRFNAIPREDGHYVVRVSGALGICYTGPLDLPITEEDDWAKDCDILICDGHRGPDEAVRLGKRDGVSHILVSNHPSFADDAELSEKEEKARRSCPNLSYARQGTVYTID